MGGTRYSVPLTLIVPLGTVLYRAVPRGTFLAVWIYNVSATHKKIVTQRENSCKLVIARQA